MTWPFGTSETDFLTGGDGDDILWGLGGDDTIDGWLGGGKLYGGSGDDILSTTGHAALYGGSGDDWLRLAYYPVPYTGPVKMIGGSGHDTFQFDIGPAAPRGKHHILDFNPRQDNIVFDAAGGEDVHYSRKSGWIEVNDEKIVKVGRGFEIDDADLVT